MQENNFESIVNTWRRLYGEQVESSALISMSGDSQGSHSHRKEEDTDLLVPERANLPVGTMAAEVAATSDIPHNGSEIKPEEKHELVEHNKEETKEAGGDSSKNEEKKDPDYLEHNDDIVNKYPESKWDAEKLGDNVDSVYLRPPPPHKVISNTSTNEEEDCGIKCLYYTLQCCDCVLM